MQANIALGLIELSSIAAGVEAADAMCKAAGVELMRSAAIARGKYVIVITGPTGEVESSLRAGLDIAGKTVLASYIIRNVHSAVLAGFGEKSPVKVLGAVGMIETKDALASVFAADAACKAASVHLIELRPGAGGGKGFFTVCGEVGAVRAAIAAGANAVGEDALVAKIVLPQAHEHLLKALC
ncbi:MAG: BMC domain-containing protein [Elusimicrobiales bacterium]|nr:BMC domain-containing protein [Elusimicrobiales bacterium]